MRTSAKTGQVDLQNWQDHATALLHILYWAMVDNNVPRRKEWRIYLEVSCRLMAPGAPRFLQLATSLPSGQLAESAHAIRRQQRHQEFDDFEAGESLVARTLPGHPLSARLGFGPVERTSSVLLLLRQSTSSGGFNSGRAPYSIFLEGATTLLGDPPIEESRAAEKGKNPHIYTLSEILDKANVDPVMARPAQFVPDAAYANLLKTSRWMDPSSPEAQRS